MDCLIPHLGSIGKPISLNMKCWRLSTKTQSAQIICSDYTKTMERAEIGDVIYCDPPYVPLSVTASFTKYHSTGFGRADQEHLVFMARACAKKGIPVIVSNHDTDFVQHLYLGAHIISFNVQRNISCNGKRQKSCP